MSGEAGFAAELRRLRRERGLSLAALSERTHYSKGYLGNLEHGRRPATLDLARRLDEVLDADGMLVALAAAVPEPVCPYRGLAAFQTADARWFFGRERVTGELATALAAARERGAPLVVFGASGAGKSSLLRAGLAPRLDSVEIITPGPDPLRRLPTAGAVLVVDQFEEVFTLCESAAERSEFLAELCRRGADGVVLAVRADFFPQCLAQPELLEVVRHNQFAVGAMSRLELAEAISGPAEASRLTVEPGLVELLLSDLGAGERGYEPGALPLLSYALRGTWEHRVEDRLTVAGYRATGGIRGAVAAAAEQVFTQLDEDARQAARRLLLRLVRVGADGEDTRRRVPREQLTAGGRQDPALVAMEAFATARLLVLDHDTVELTHEALVRAWPRLREWIDTDRAGLRARQRLGEAVDAWVGHDRAAALTYRGIALATAQEWARGHPEDLSPVERDFLRAGSREEQRGVRRLRALVAALTAFVLIAVLAGGIALVQRQQALTARDEATSRQVGEHASSLLGADPALAGQLALAAYQLAETPAARGAVLSAFATAYPTRLHGGAEQVDVVALRPDGGLLATGGLDGVVQLWDATDGRRDEPLRTLPNTGRVSGLEFSPDGRTLALAGAGGVALWDVVVPQRPELLAALLPRTKVNQLAFSPDGALLATAGSADALTRVWSLRDLRAPRQVSVLPGHAGEVYGLAFSPDGPTLATAGADGAVLGWRLADPANPGAPQRILTARGPVSAIAYSQDGRRLVVADETHTLWQVSEGVPRTVPAPDVLVRGLAFGPDPDRVVLGANDGVLRVLDLVAGREIERLRQPNRVRAIAFDRAGRLLASSSSGGRSYLWHEPLGSPVGRDSEIDGVFGHPGSNLLATTGVQDPRVRLWRTDWSGLLPLGTLSGHTGAVQHVAFSADGRRLATGSRDRTVRLWDLGDPAHPVELSTLDGYRETVGRVAFSPDGTLLASGDDAGDLVLWNVADPRRPRRLAILADNFRTVNAVAFSPDGRSLASGNTDRSIRLWDLADPGNPQQTAKITGFREAVLGVAFSPDGRTLAGAGLDQTVRLWTVTDPARPAGLATVTGHLGPVHTAEFSPDGRTLVTTSADRTARLWDLTDPAQPALYAPLASPDAPVTNVFHAGGRRIAVAAAGHTLRFWDTDPAAAVNRLCALRGSPVTAAEWAARFPDYPYRPPCG
ncbi:MULTISPECIES: helix-turn-helix domain-containing protein [unclassified Crossiella]|uniref:nSTAND1 domain-containing NTPase n=1 Tax=unclassified Crossiella TaxID=2620835 RepID=UPI001FFF89BB|nr:MULTISPECIES: helix-turn-helix domain-containing protein [unclassified Crossiella]MCK2241418.1 helix-turn-helix domain-containing protein [Crossiella sp. S99.2]MCK2257036.1 helix-turn-helix domain-containing protein [Crossiella sp. S99.1]